MLWAVLSLIVAVSLFCAIKRGLNLDGFLLHTICFAGAFSACGLAGAFWGWNGYLLAITWGICLAIVSGTYWMYREIVNVLKQHKVRE